MESKKFDYDLCVDDIQYEIDVNRNEVGGEKALLNASVEGDYETIEQLLNSGICVDAKEYNKLLFYASKNYFTPLQLATLNRHERCAQLLIDYGADVNAKDLFGLTALHLAACNGAYNILKILLRANADCNVPIKFSYCVPLKYSACPGCCKAPHLGGTTPLHLAAGTNNLDCVKELIHYGADFNAVDEIGRTSLYVAAQLGYSECVMIHLKEAVGRDILSLPSLQTSDTPLHFAVKYRMIDCVKELLYLGSDVNHRNFDGLSPLHTALLPVNANISEQLTVLKMLVLEGYKTDINQPDWEGYTALHYVVFNGHRNMWSRRPEMAKFLISYGANVNIADAQKSRLLVKELRYPEENFEVLRYIVKSLLYLPPLKILFQGFQFEPELAMTRNLLSESLHNNMPLQLQNLDRLLNGNLFPVLENQNSVEPPRQRMAEASSPSLVPPAYPQFINQLNSRFSDLEGNRERMQRHIANFNSLIRTERHPFPHSFVLDSFMDTDYDVDLTETSPNNAQSLLLQKQLWYEDLASRPRTLKHHCRYLIRQTLGPMKLKYIKDLPVPPIIQSYLLLELEE